MEFQISNSEKKFCRKLVIETSIIVYRLGQMRVTIKEQVIFTGRHKITTRFIVERLS
jgi:hypothetical protein